MILIGRAHVPTLGHTLSQRCCVISRPPLSARLDRSIPKSPNHPFLSSPSYVIRYSWKPFPPEISSSPPISLSSFLSQSFPLSSCLSALMVGIAAVTVRCGLEVEGVLFFSLSPCPLTLHIYADGLDGSHPHPVVGLAVVATPLHPLDALDA